MECVKAQFGSMVFSDIVMREHLPRDVYLSLRKTIDEGRALEASIAQVVASAMKDWAIENGATHYSHWFVPMTGATAEKHEAFLSPCSDGRVIMEFSGKNLIMGEPDASSFPSGGLRATFEARGYTTWDCTSPAFIKDNTLYIPTAFCSYNGDALDKKTPLLRSMTCVSEAAVRLLHLFGMGHVRRVYPMAGPEQEYFLVDKKYFNKRPDLMFTGRTLLGRPAPKGQEMSDQYYSTLKQRVSDYMKELDLELSRVGVIAKTRHNETAPAQHEMAPHYDIVNIAADHNHLAMELMKKIADRHGLVCLLHEKPFLGVNGSGKHNNWSLQADDGFNLLEPGDNPESNVIFLLTLCAVITAIDRHSDLIQMAIATAGNDHRLGAHEAPPSIISLYMGRQMTDMLVEIETGILNRSVLSPIKSNVATLPELEQDACDRNRTSPIAFTGNKFEIRMVGSSASIAGVNTLLNAIVAESLYEMADELGAVPEADERFEHAYRLMKDRLSRHNRVLYNGNNYSAEWVSLARERGLLVTDNTVDALQCLKKKENVELLERLMVYTGRELESRYDILMDNYVKTVLIEARTLVSMIMGQIAPAVLSYMGGVARDVASVRGVGLGIDLSAFEKRLSRIGALSGELNSRIEELSAALRRAEGEIGVFERARVCRDELLTGMVVVREIADELEGLVAREAWPFPGYSELLFSV